LLQIFLLSVTHLQLIANHNTKITAAQQRHGQHVAIACQQAAETVFNQLYYKLNL